MVIAVRKVSLKIFNGKESKMELLVILLIGVALYFTPALFAYGNKHRSKEAIALFVMFFGWTVVGWFMALIWAHTGNREE